MCHGAIFWRQKIWSRQREDIDNKRKKKKFKKVKKKTSQFFCYFIALSKKTLFTITTFRGNMFWKKASRLQVCIFRFQSLIMTSKSYVRNLDPSKNYTMDHFLQK